MPLPNILEFIGTNITQRKFQQAQEKLLNYLGVEVPTKADLSNVSADLNAKIIPKADKTYVDNALTAIAGGHKAYQTLALAQAAQATLPANTVVEVTNDPTTSNNGTYQWNGTTLTKSAYDPVAQAKTYTDTYGQSTKKIIASEVISRKIEGVVTALINETPPIQITKVTSDGSYIYELEVKPNTTYTIYTKYNAPDATFRFYDKKPTSWLTQTVAQGGFYQTLQVVVGSGRYHTFTTDSATTVVAYNPSQFDNKRFILLEGVYDYNNWSLFNSITFNKQLAIDSLSATAIKSPTLEYVKNLAGAYRYGLVARATAEINEEGPEVIQFLYTEASSLYYSVVGMYIKVEPNTTYTISKEVSNRFAITLGSLTTSRVVFRDSGKLSHTLTTNSTDTLMFIYLSSNYEKPRVQVELGSTVTPYETPGFSLKNGSISGLEKLTDTKKETDNTYISLGTQSDKYAYPVGNTTRNTATIIDDFYEPLLDDFPSLVTKNLLSRDSSDTYDIFEYVFEPDAYEQTILITAGMHPTEAVPPFALGMLMTEIYRNPSKHEGLAYLRNKVKIVVIPVVNVWGMNQQPKSAPLTYLNANGVNPVRNFPAMWESIQNDNAYDSKGSEPLSEKETKVVYDVLNREKDELAFYLDLHTGQGWTSDSMVYMLDEDDFLRPELMQVISMYNDIVRKTKGREPVNETMETARATSMYYAQRVLGVPAGIIEYGTAGTTDLYSEQTTFYTDQLFNYIHYALKAKLKEKRLQAEKNEQNKPFISLYNTLAGYNEVLNNVWTYAQWQTNLYDKLGLNRSVIGAASGNYELVKYTHAPVGYKNTIVLSAGINSNRKSTTELGFIAHKIMTDKNPHIVALRSSTRFIFIPSLNPYGHDNATANNANNVEPYASFSTSTQPESVALRGFIDAGGIDLYVDLDSSAVGFEPEGNAKMQIIYNTKADIYYQAIFDLLGDKYSKSLSVDAKGIVNLSPRSPISAYVSSKGFAYTYAFLAQNVLPKRVTTEGVYVDKGFEPDELAYCSEVLLNSIKIISDRLNIAKYIAAN